MTLPKAELFPNNPLSNPKSICGQGQKSRRCFLVFNSLPIRLSLVISLILMSFILAGMLLIGFYWFVDLKIAFKEYGKSVVGETANTLNQVFVQAEQTAQNVATVLETQRGNRKEIATMIAPLLCRMNSHCRDLGGLTVAWRENMLVPGEKYNAIVGTEKNGTCNTISFNDKKFDYLYKDWFVIPLTLEKPLWTMPYWDPNTKRTLLSYSVPFFYKVEGKRTVAGVVVVDIPVQNLEKYLKDAKMASLRWLSTQSEIFLMSQFGQIVIYPNRPEQLSKSLYTICDEPESPLPDDRKQVQEMFQHKSGKIQLKSAPVLDESSDLYYSSCVNGWVVSIAVPSDWFRHLVMPLFLKFLCGWFVATLLIVWAIFMVCHRLSRPLTKLSEAAAAVGHGDFSAPLPPITSDDEIGRLTGSFTRMQSELADYIVRLRETLTAQERATGELNAAHSIQKDLLPRVLPPCDGCLRIRSAADLIPARGVGGDLYDIFKLDENRIVLIIGDVSGKGIPAALFMAETQILQRTLAQTETQPHVLVNRLNDALNSSNDAGMFVTYWIGFLNLHNGHLEYCNAGHNPPVLKKANGETVFLKTPHGPPIAILPEYPYETNQLQLDEGDTIFLYTDGVTEAFNMTDEMFGEDRLLTSLNSLSTSEPEPMIDSVKQSVFAFRGEANQSDDITVLAVRYESDTSPVPSILLETSMDHLQDAIDFVEKQPAIQLLTPKVRNEFLVCVEEIFVNIVKYAYANQQGTVEIIYNEDTNAKMALFSFVDHGTPFNPLDHEDPDISLPANERPIGGLGIYIVKKATDFANYEYRDGQNILTVGKKYYL